MLNEKLREKSSPNGVPCPVILRAGLGLHGQPYVVCKQDPALAHH
jgi:hypothetical protein